MSEIKSYYKRTKIIATLGPSITQKIFTKADFEDPKNANAISLGRQRMEAIFLRGVNVVRLNFSHGEHEEQQIRIDMAKEIAKKVKRNIAIILDTKGPEIRVGEIKDGPVKVIKDSTITIRCLEQIVGSATDFSVNDSTKKYNMAKDVKVDSIILVDDGKLKLKAIEVKEKEGLIKAIALNEHTINDKKRINLPNAKYSMSFLSQKDKGDLLFGIANKVNYIAASFVNSRANVNEIRKFLDDNGGKNIQIISKIETGHAVNNFDEILDASDAIMVARGDLALEINFCDVPYWQKKIIRKCRIAGKPVIVATQMLDSLEKNIQPTRAEVTDVFFAVERGTDATMLSGESAQGQFPIDAVSTMRKINKRSEILFDYWRAVEWYFPKTKWDRKYKKIAMKINKLCIPEKGTEEPVFKYNFVVVFTNDETLIRTLSNLRIAATILVVSDKEELRYKFALYYGIMMHIVEDLTKAKADYINVANYATSLLEFKDQRFLVYFGDERKFKPID